MGRLVLFAIILATTACNSESQGGPTKHPLERDGFVSLNVMAYNVENLFDTEHDEGKTDWTYLPLEFKKQSETVQRYCQSLSNEKYKQDCLTIDWNESILNKKIHQIARVIQSTFEGQGPDILVLEEVENIHVLTMLNEIGFWGHTFSEVILLESPDERGIDVGILSRFPLSKTPVLHPIELQYQDGSGKTRTLKTRGILEARFHIGSQDVTVLANHWPSQGNAPVTRMRAAEVLQKVADEVGSDHLIAAGDFNTLVTENPHPFEEFLLKLNLPVVFLDSNRVRRQQDPEALWPGTHFYNWEWSELDHIFVNKNLNQSTEMIPHWETFNIYAPDFVLHEVSRKENGETKRYKVPNRFNAQTGEGFADHLPVLMNFSVKR